MFVPLVVGGGGLGSTPGSGSQDEWEDAKQQHQEYLDDHQPSRDQHPAPAHRPDDEDAMRLQAALEDELTELTASSWVQQQQASSQHHSRALHSSGVLFAATAGGPQNSLNDPVSSSSSRHAGFFQVQPTDTSIPSGGTRPKTAGPATRPKTLGLSMSQQHLEPNQQDWLLFQQVPGASDSPGVLYRSSSSPVPAAKPHSGVQQLLEGPAATGYMSNSSRMPSAAQGPQARGFEPRPTVTAGGAGGALPSRLSLDSATMRGVVTRSSTPPPAGRQHYYAAAPASPEDEEEDASGGLDGVQTLSQGFVSCTPQEARLLRQLAHNLPTHADQSAYASSSSSSSQQQPMPSRRQGAAGPAEPQLLERPASSPPYLLDTPQERQLLSAIGSARAASRPSSPYLPRSPRAAAPAVLHQQLAPEAWEASQQYGASAGYGTRSPRCRSPSVLAPDAAASAAAAAAATSIQQAMAAVDEEIEQLKLLQHLQQRRRRLQATARAALAHATSAAAAAAAAAAQRQSQESTGALLGRPGSMGSSTGSNVGNSASSSSSGPSTASLGPPPPAGYTQGMMHQQGYSPALLHQHLGDYSSGSSSANQAAWPMHAGLSGSPTARGMYMAMGGLEPHTSAWAELPDGFVNQHQVVPGIRVTPRDDVRSQARWPPAAVGPSAAARAQGPPHVHMDNYEEPQDDLRGLVGDAQQLLELQQALHLLGKM